MATHIARAVCDHPHSTTQPRPHYPGDVYILVPAQSNAVHNVNYQIVPRKTHGTFTYLRRSNHPHLLRSPNQQPPTNPIQIRITPQTLPIPPTPRHASHRPNKRAKRNMNALALVFPSQRLAILEHQIPIKRRTKMNARWERGYEFLSAHTGWCVCET